MSPQVLCSDCPECHSEVLVKLGMSRCPDSPASEPLYRISCSTCGRTYDIRFEDLALRNKSEAELKSSPAVTTFAWR
jgi:transposase-like protein